MVIGPGKGDVKATVILADGEFLPENLNDEKVIVYRKGDSTNRELLLVKPYGEVGGPELTREPHDPVCNYSGDGNPLHKHEDGTWWFFEETWAYENGPFLDSDEAYDALQEYCENLQRLKEVQDETPPSDTENNNLDNLS